MEFTASMPRQRSDVIGNRRIWGAANYRSDETYVTTKKLPPSSFPYFEAERCPNPGQTYQR